MRSEVKDVLSNKDSEEFMLNKGFPTFVLGKLVALCLFVPEYSPLRLCACYCVLEVPAFSAWQGGATVEFFEVLRILQ
jgi:hypothetical protein